MYKHTYSGDIKLCRSYGHDPNCKPKDVQGALPLSGGPAVLSAYHGLAVMGMGATNWFSVFSSEASRCSIMFNHV
jgi:hypothetical protein